MTVLEQIIRTFEANHDGHLLSRLPLLATVSQMKSGILVVTDVDKTLTQDTQVELLLRGLKENGLVGVYNNYGELHEGLTVASFLGDALDAYWRLNHGDISHAVQHELEDMRTMVDYCRNTPVSVAKAIGENMMINPLWLTTQLSNRRKALGRVPEIGSLEPTVIMAFATRGDVTPLYYFLLSPHNVSLQKIRQESYQKKMNFSDEQRDALKNLFARDDPCMLMFFREVMGYGVGIMGNHYNKHVRNDKLEYRGDFEADDNTRELYGEEMCMRIKASGIYAKAGLSLGDWGEYRVKRDMQLRGGDGILPKPSPEHVLMIVQQDSMNLEIQKAAYFLKLARSVTETIGETLTRTANAISVTEFFEGLYSVGKEKKMVLDLGRQLAHEAMRYIPKVLHNIQDAASLIHTGGPEVRDSYEDLAYFSLEHVKGTPEDILDPILCTR